MYKLSPSTLKLLEDCPRCFWLQVVKKVSRPSSIFPSLPSGVDKIVKEHFDRFRKKGSLPPELAREKVDAELFGDMKLLKAWRNNRKGIQFFDKEKDILLRGAVDEILQKDGKLIVLDFKTRGFALKEDTHHYYQDQLDIYNFLFRKNGYKTEDFAYLLFYVPEKIMESGDFVFDTKLVKMGVSEKHAEDLFKKAEKILIGDMPKPSNECEFCKWQEGLGALDYV